ncbi:hypothetical protein OPHB3_1953 [Oceanobacillus picturae]|uniref:Uncharacterized protein n=1 Tax=Oceanobacillus picturae TaxID=171693 RepID=A0A0U9H5S9_9BACI|nr:hypothetical protein [Oceanobacillus picturae]GAQ18014.1 hypothetical protein OPHB3_1953 [Oceanobacillus picturae]
MSELLTTGAMIDRLKVGGTAELSEKHQISKEHGKSYKKVTKAADGDIVWISDTGVVDLGRPLVLFGHTVNWKWRIIPNYVSFKEATKTHKEDKKTVTYHHDEELKYTFEYETDPEQFEQLYYDSISLHELIEGKWTIEND